MGTAIAAADGIYGYTDDDGVTHLSNVPDRGPYQLMLRNPDDYRLRSKPDYRLKGGADNCRRTRRSPTRSLPPPTPTAWSRRCWMPSSPSSRTTIPAALSPKGAMGLMQLMPDTSRRFGVADPWHPDQNIRGGARYLSELLALFDNDLPLALAAYNAGEQTVIRYGRRVPPFPETRSYVKRVMAIYGQSTPSAKAPNPGPHRLRAM